MVAAAKYAGARTVIAADINDAALRIAKAMGADEVRNVSGGGSLPEDMELVFEASGIPAVLGGVLRATARGGTLIQVGNLPGAPAPAALGDLVTREITWIGSYRFVDEISDALRAMAAGLDVSPVITHTFGIDQAAEAMRVFGGPCLRQQQSHAPASAQLSSSRCRFGGSKRHLLLPTCIHFPLT